MKVRFLSLRPVRLFGENMVFLFSIVSKFLNVGKISVPALQPKNANFYREQTEVETLELEFSILVPDPTQHCGI